LMPDDWSDTHEVLSVPHQPGKETDMGTTLPEHKRRRAP
jgi:hypothetical protein